jgi:hypothetical protein
VADSPFDNLVDETPESGRLKIILGVDYGTTFTGKLLSWSLGNKLGLTNLTHRRQLCDIRQDKHR